MKCIKKIGLQMSVVGGNPKMYLQNILKLHIFCHQFHNFVTLVHSDTKKYQHSRDFLHTVACQVRHICFFFCTWHKEKFVFQNQFKTWQPQFILFSAVILIAGEKFKHLLLFSSLYWHEPPSMLPCSTFRILLLHTCTFYFSKLSLVAFKGALNKNDYYDYYN